MIEIITRPQQTVTEDIPQTSRWNSAHQPTIFEIQREDYQLSLVEENTGTGGGVLLTIDEDITAELTVGDTIYLFVDGYFDGHYTIESFEYSGSPAVTTIVIDATPYTGGSLVAQGFVNLFSGRTGYFVEVKILEYSTGTPVEISDEYARFRPSSTGLVTADLSAWLATIVTAANESDYLSRVFQAENIGQPYNIQVREYWAENGVTDWSELTDDNKHGVVNGVKQIGQTYGQNFGEHVMFPADETSPIYDGSRAQFMTMFEQPVYFTGYPFDLSIIVNDDITEVKKIEELTDSNSTFIEETRIELDYFADYVNRIRLEENYSDETKFVSVTLRSGGEDCVPSGTNIIQNHDFAITDPMDPSFEWDVTGSNSQVIDFGDNLMEFTGVSGSEASGEQVVYQNISIDSNEVYYLSFHCLQLLQVSTPIRARAFIYLVDTANNKTCQISLRLNGVTVTSNNGEGIYIMDSSAVNPEIPLDTSGTIYGIFTLTIRPEYWNQAATRPNGIHFKAQGRTGDDDIGFDIIDMEQCTTTAPEYVESDTEDTFGSIALSETKTVVVDPVCVDNPVFLCWLNPLGGFDYWLFHTAQDISMIVGGEKTFEQYISDIAAATSRTEVLKKEARDEYLIGAEQLTVAQMEGIKYLFSSPKVMMFVEYDTDGSPVWKGVRVNSGSFLVEKTDENKIDVTFKISLPERYLQTQ